MEGWSLGEGGGDGWQEAKLQKEVKNKRMGVEMSEE